MRYIKSFQNENAIQDAVDNKVLGKPYVALNESAGTIDWNSKEIDYSNMYLTIEALSGGTFYVRNANIGYSVNGAAWETTTGVTELSLNQGDTVRFKGTGGAVSGFTGNTLLFKAYGNIESMEYGDDFYGKTSIKGITSFGYCFFECSGMTDASNLILPATTLKSYCYMYMFYKCSNITKAPVLPAYTVPVQGYRLMFGYCTNLNYIKCMATNITASNCVSNWVQNVQTISGTFVKAASMTGWPTGNNGIPSGWTIIEE